MRKLNVLAVLLVTVGTLWAEDPTIAVHRVQQRYPWNGMVDIDYTVANVPEGREAEFYVQFDVVENGNSHTLHTMLDASTLIEASNGTYRVTWASAWEDAEYHFLAKNAKMKASIVYCGEDKSENPYGDLYVIVDLAGGSTATIYPVSYCLCDFAKATNRFNTIEFKTSKLVLRRVLPGTFMMGSPVGEYGREYMTSLNKETQHQVTLTQAYLLGIFEVTAAQYCRVMGGNSLSSVLPVANVSYQTLRGSNASTGGCSVPPQFGKVDAGSFMERISTRTGLVFDLPTEAQWEYACRAGTTNSTYAGSVTTTPNATTASIAWYVSNAAQRSQSVGQKIPNAWGFYDMLGNVWEQCRDRVTAAPNDDLGAAPVIDPLTGVNGNVVYRGGCVVNDARCQRAACRYGGDTVTSATGGGGFRLSAVLP